MNEKVHNLVDPDWLVKHVVGDDKCLLEYPDGSVRFQHVCYRPSSGYTLIHAPRLQLDGGHTITRNNPITVTPSIMCDDCGTHGFVTDGVWRDC